MNITIESNRQYKKFGSELSTRDLVVLNSNVYYVVGRQKYTKNQTDIWAVNLTTGEITYLNPEQYYTLYTADMTVYPMEKK